MPVFDFHVHPALKPQMSDPANLPSPWEIIKIKFKHPNLLTSVLKCSGINAVIDSQASLTQLVKGKVKLIGLALHPPESHFLRDPIINTIAAEEQTHYINLNRIRDIASGDIYFRMLNEELANIRTHLSNNGMKLKIIDRFSQFKPNAANTVFAVLIPEGPHAFFGIRQNQDENAIWNTFWNNFDGFTGNNRLLSINIAHLQPNDFCNHAYGIQVFSPRPFYPDGYGITHQGFKLLQRMEGKGIQTDIKHMSLYARQQLYQYRLQENHLPLICTHAGLTGLSVSGRGRFFHHREELASGHLRVEHFKPAGYLAGTSFNASSINLYDEDVKEVMGSGGLIGLSFDQRILGVPDAYLFSDHYVGDFYDEEVLSPLEKGFFTDVAGGYPPDEEILDHYDITTEDKQNYPRWHARHFLNQVFHFFVIAQKQHINPEYAITRICLGSDFDGLINPIDCCSNVAELEKFKGYLLEHFITWEKEFTEITALKPSDLVSPQKLLDDIFYNNAVSFLQEHFV